MAGKLYGPHQATLRKRMRVVLEAGKSGTIRGGTGSWCGCVGDCRKDGHGVTLSPQRLVADWVRSDYGFAILDAD